ncbi:hypothetical protein FSS13T_10090 [Flavobacterium saliperosum S13]|uniref:Four helix bundle protein n=2 Tax=Flavobacterium saliperosum TaxID=329186 RepID=A0A1G4VYA3_9FLAO|nr:four helix bundle protein [Flavobacterium saliperosum]ESU26839.1 hypothetical protein FSS13T_10090 [Flavobacterium saliperosum S13]SCX13303.1 four helix bundle protein [Flavobacterium saliperosum]
MAVQKFEDLIVWQKSQDFAVHIYNQFATCKDYGFKDQITRASISISNNIAEGFERKSNADFSRFLYFSLGSVSEARSMLYIATRLGFVPENNTKEMIEKSNEISKNIIWIGQFFEQNKPNY